MIGAVHRLPAPANHGYPKTAFSFEECVDSPGRPGPGRLGKRLDPQLVERRLNSRHDTGLHAHDR